MNKPYATTLLGQYIAEEHYDRLPKEVIVRAKRCVQDSVACLLASYATTPAKIAHNFAQACVGSDDSHILGSSTKTDCSTAVFVNATLINALDIDDVYWKGHLGATVMAAAFSLGEKLNCSGRDFITAVVAGYEVSGRVGLSLQHQASRKHIHGHGTWQTFGATGAAAKLLGMKSQNAAHAMAISAVNAPVASVMKTVYGIQGATMAKNNFGTAADTGVTAALLAHDGFEGPLDVFEGETGFWRMFGADSYEPEPWISTIGLDYEILNVGFKRFPACKILQSSIEAALKACAALDNLDDIDRIELSASPIVGTEPFKNPRPNNMQAAQFSAPFAIAQALIGIDSGPAWFQGDVYDDPRVVALAEKVKISPNTNISAGESNARHQHPATVTIKSQGEIYQAQVDVALGDAMRPLSDAEHYKKFISLASCRLPEKRAVEIFNQLETLEQAPSLRPLIMAMVP